MKITATACYETKKYETAGSQIVIHKIYKTELTREDASGQAFVILINVLAIMGIITPISA